MRALTLLFVWMAAFAVAPAAENASAAGRWKLYADIAGHQSELECTFTQKENDLAGTCKNAQDAFAVTGKLAEKKITFQYKTVYEGQDLTVLHTGVFDTAEQITGTVEVDPMGVSGEFTLTQLK